MGIYECAAVIHVHFLMNPQQNDICKREISWKEFGKLMVGKFLKVFESIRGIEYFMSVFGISKLDWCAFMMNWNH